MSDPSHGLGPKADNRAWKVYLACFEYHHWVSLLKMVLKISGPVLDSSMKRFNNVNSLVRKSIQVRFLITDIHRAIKA